MGVNMGDVKMDSNGAEGDKPELWAALLALQAEALAIQRDAEGQIQNRKYKYATLTALNEKMLPRLAHYGLLWTTKPIRDEDGEHALAYRMLHVASGERETGIMGLGVDTQATPQMIGSAITYMRRYSFMAILNVVPVETDDDGAKVPRAAAERKLTERRRTNALSKLLARFDSLQTVELFLGSIGVTTRSEEWTDSDLLKMKRGLEKRGEKK